ncbi:MAG: hypothetical protein AAF316_10445 [Cyanobacteria bacterium P01_A01_bin.80]
MTQAEERLSQVEEAQRRTQAQLDQLTEAQLQTQTSLKQMSTRVDEFVFQTQRLLTQQAGRLNTVEGRAERLEAIVQRLDRNYEEEKASMVEFRITTNAALERIDRILDFLMKGSEDSENS